MSGSFRVGLGLGSISPHCRRVRVPGCRISVKKNEIVDFSGNCKCDNRGIGVICNLWNGWGCGFL